MKRFIQILLVVMAGETIFMLPFLIPRLLRPLIIESWGLTNQDIGMAFSAYGLTSIASYFLGGPLADRYSARKLVSLSLIFTALGGMTLALFPSKTTFIFIYAFFGVSTILLMWGALIKLAHICGGHSTRASAMGILDGGRGLCAALMSAILVYLLAKVSVSADSLLSVYTAVSLYTFVLGGLVWFGLHGFVTPVAQDKDVWSVEKVKELLKRRDIWLLSFIILCSYCGYKSIDNYSIYLVDVMNKSLAQSSELTGMLFWLRPPSAIIAGLLVDHLVTRFNLSRFLSLSVLLFLSGISQLLLALQLFENFSTVFVIIISSATLVYALRAVYFAVFDELDIPTYLLGSAVGIVSVIGFLPDLFFGALTGTLIDKFPGAEGYTYVYLFTGLILLSGAACAFCLRKKKGE